MYLKVNSEKTDYIRVGSGQQLQKSTSTPLNADGDLVNLSEVIRYLGILRPDSKFQGTHKTKKQRKQWQVSINYIHQKILDCRYLHYPSINAVNITPQL